jgi:hypothetical protein
MAVSRGSGPAMKPPSPADRAAAAIGMSCIRITAIPDARNAPFQRCESVELSQRELDSVLCGTDDGNGCFSSSAARSSTTCLQDPLWPRMPRNPHETNRLWRPMTTLATCHQPTIHRHLPAFPALTFAAEKISGRITAKESMSRRRSDCVLGRPFRRADHTPSASERVIGFGRSDYLRCLRALKIISQNPTYWQSRISRSRARSASARLARVKRVTCSCA